MENGGLHPLVMSKSPLNMAIEMASCSMKNMVDLSHQFCRLPEGHSSACAQDPHGWLLSGKLTVCYWKWPCRYSWFTRSQWWLSIVLLVYFKGYIFCSILQSQQLLNLHAVRFLADREIAGNASLKPWISIILYLKAKHIGFYRFPRVSWGFLGFPEISLPSSNTPWSLVSCLVPFPFPWPPRPHQDWTMFDPRSPVTAGYGPQASGWSMRTCSTMNKHPF